MWNLTTDTNELICKIQQTYRHRKQTYGYQRGKEQGEGTITSLTFRDTATAAAAKSLQSCPTLCDPIDGSPPGSPVPGILQVRTLEWVAISFSRDTHYYIYINKQINKDWLYNIRNYIYYRVTTIIEKNLKKNRHALIYNWIILLYIWN